MWPPGLMDGTILSGHLGAWMAGESGIFNASGSRGLSLAAGDRYRNFVKAKS